MEEKEGRGAASLVKYQDHYQCREDQGKESNMNRGVYKRNGNLLGQQPTVDFPSYGYNIPNHFGLDSQPVDMSTYCKSGMDQCNFSFSSTNKDFNKISGMEKGPVFNSGVNSSGFMSGVSNMFGEMGMENFNQYCMMNQPENVMVSSVHQVVQLSQSTLYPPAHSELPITRDKPPGCKTVFVGGLPENVTEEIIKEIFEQCGEILAIRLSKRNFCHIRFANEAFVESAIFLSGYRIKIENKDDNAYKGRLHVDYAFAEDDQYEYECQQRALQREARHREHLDQNNFNPPIVQYSKPEAAILGEKLRCKDTFQQAVVTLITWLEKGECNKRNSGIFYSMIQSTNGHVRKLMNEKQKYEGELNKAKDVLKQQMKDILLHFSEVEKVFNAASLQKVWDHFTKPQRKNIEFWRKDIEKNKNAHVEAVLKDRVEDEMDLSDDENFTEKSQNGSTDDEKNALIEEINKIQEENDSLRCQLIASQNEVMLLKSEKKQGKDLSEQHLTVIREAVQGLQKEIISLNQKCNEEEAELNELQAFKLRCDNLSIDDSFKSNEISHYTERQRYDVECGTSSSSSSFTMMEAHLIALISGFLLVHPFGASSEYICYYLHNFYSTLTVQDVDNLMRRFPLIYKEAFTGIGASLARRWIFSFKPEF